MQLQQAARGPTLGRFPLGSWRIVRRGHVAHEYRPHFRRLGAAKVVKMSVGNTDGQFHEIFAHSSRLSNLLKSRLATVRYT